MIPALSRVGGWHDRCHYDGWLASWLVGRTRRHRGTSYGSAGTTEAHRSLSSAAVPWTHSPTTRHFPPPPTVPPGNGLQEHQGRTHTHIHTFNGPFARTTWVSRYQKGQKGRISLDLNDARVLG